MIQVERRVPVEICKRRRFDEDSIFLSRGRIFRKAGEKSRKTLFRRKLSFDTQKENSTASTEASISTTTLRPNTVINPITESGEDSNSDSEAPARDISDIELKLII